MHEARLQHGALAEELREGGVGRGEGGAVLARRHAKGGMHWKCQCSEPCPCRAASSRAAGLSLGVTDPNGAAMRTFAQLVLQQPALPQGEFQCVASDFSRICRGKLGADALARYVQRRASVPAA